MSDELDPMIDPEEEEDELVSGSLLDDEEVDDVDVESLDALIDEEEEEDEEESFDDVNEL